MYRKTKRPIQRVFLHCSASNNPKHNDVSVMREWHIARGFRTVGYHYFIQTGGVVQAGRDPEQVPAAQEGNNAGTIAICLHGLNVEDFTLAQFDSLRKLVGEIHAAYPDATYHGHCEVSSKLCPVFDYRAVLGLDSAGHLARAYATPATKSPVQSEDTLALGSQGKRVEELQQLLKIRVDGDFGDKTETAVRTFQHLHGLLADGRAGKLTMAALRKPGKTVVYEEPLKPKAKK